MPVASDKTPPRAKVSLGVAAIVLGLALNAAWLTVLAATAVWLALAL